MHRLLAVQWVRHEESAHDRAIWMKNGIDGFVCRLDKGRPVVGYGLLSLRFRLKQTALRKASSTGRKVVIRDVTALRREFTG